MVFLSPCWSVLSLGQFGGCSLFMVEFGIWHIVHSLGSYMPLFLKWAGRQSCPVLSLKFATASFIGLPLCSSQFLWISLHFFVAASSSASCLYFVVVLQFKSFFFFSESVGSGVSLVCGVVPFWLVYLPFHCHLVQHGREPTGIWLFLKVWRCLSACCVSFIFFYSGWLLEETAWIAAFWVHEDDHFFECMKSV